MAFTNLGVTKNDRPSSINQVATLPSSLSGVSINEYGPSNSSFRTTVLTLSSLSITMTDEAGVVAYGGKQLLDMPEGGILFLGCHADLDITKSGAGINADFDGDFGLGTVTASNNNSLSSTEQNLIPTTSTPQAAAGVTTANGQSTAVAFIDGNSTPADVYLNFLIDDADQNGGGALLVSGTIIIHWVPLGNY